jgi:hypothetical protein
MASNVATEQRLLDLPTAIAPLAINRVERQIAQDALFLEPGLDPLFMMMLGVQCIPARLNLKAPIRIVMESHDMPELRTKDQNTEHLASLPSRGIFFRKKFLQTQM